MSIKNYGAHVKAQGDEGRFTALVAVFGNVDLQGDRIVKGAFVRSIAAWRAMGDPIPVVWSHDWGNAHSIIGSVDPENVVETADGLLVKDAQLDVDTNETARQVWDLMKRRVIREFSFAYDVVNERTGRDGANELLTLSIIEVGPTLKGANPETQLIGVKSAGAATDLRETVANEELAHAALMKAQDIYASAWIENFVRTGGQGGAVELSYEDRKRVEALVGSTAELKARDAAELELQREISRRANDLRERRPGPTREHEERARQVELAQMAKRYSDLRPPRRDPSEKSARTFATDGEFAEYLGTAGFDAEMIAVAMGGETAEELRERRARERRAKAMDEFEQANRALLAGPIPSASTDREREREQYARTIAGMKEREAVARAEQDLLDAQREERRRAAPRQFGGES